MSEGVDEETRAAMIRQLEGEAAARKAKDERTPTSEARQKREIGSPPREAKLRYDLEVEKALTKLWKTRVEECTEAKATLEEEAQAKISGLKKEIASLEAALTAEREAREQTRDLIEHGVEYIERERDRAMMRADVDSKLAEVSLSKVDELAKELAERPTVEKIVEKKVEVLGPLRVEHEDRWYLEVRLTLLIGGVAGLSLGLFAYYAVPIIVPFLQRLLFVTSSVVFAFVFMFGGGL